MTNTVLEIQSSTNVVKNPLLNSVIYFLAAYISFFYILPVVLDVSNLLGAVIFSFIIVAFSLTIVKPILAIVTPHLRLSTGLPNKNAVI